MLAKNVNDNAGILYVRGGLGFFASKLAPTGYWRSASASSKSAEGTKNRPPVTAVLKSSKRS